MGKNRHWNWSSTQVLLHSLLMGCFQGMQGSLLLTGMVLCYPKLILEAYFSSENGATWSIQPWEPSDLHLSTLWPMQDCGTAILIGHTLGWKVKCSNESCGRVCWTSFVPNIRQGISPTTITETSLVTTSQYSETLCINITWTKSQRSCDPLSFHKQNWTLRWWPPFLAVQTTL